MPASCKILDAERWRSLYVDLRKKNQKHYYDYNEENFLKCLIRLQDTPLVIPFPLSLFFPLLVSFFFSYLFIPIVSFVPFCSYNLFLYLSHSELLLFSFRHFLLACWSALPLQDFKAMLQGTKKSLKLVCSNHRL